MVSDTQFQKTLQPSDLKIGERRGEPIYKSNPSLLGMETTGRLKDVAKKVINGNKAVLYNDSTGEVMGEGSVAFMETEQVDTDRFIKIYLAGLDGMFNLTKSAQSVFKLLWMQIQAKKDNDRIELNCYIAEDYGLKIAQRGMTRGIKELLEKEFIYNTPTSGLYYFNARFMFNGNRIITAKQYVLKGSEAAQQSLDLEPAEPQEEINAGTGQ